MSSEPATEVTSQPAPGAGPDPATSEAGAAEVAVSDAGAGIGAAGDDAVAADGTLRLLDIEAAPPGTFGELEPSSPPLIDGQGRVRLSFSRIDAYSNCPRRFRYSYIDRLPGKPAPQLSFGSSIHAALEAFYDRKLPECPSEQDLLDALYQAWDTTGFAGMPREEQVAYYRHAQDVLRRFHRRVAATYRLPAVTEAWFELPVAYEAVVVGSIDRVDVDDDGRFHIIDYKTNRKVKDRRRVAGSLQLSIYALACRHLFGSLPASVSLEFVVPGVTVTVPIEDIDVDAARERILETAAAVRAGEFEPTPNPLCDWCDFKAICPAWEGDGEALLGPAVDELRRLRRQVSRDVRALREAEAGVERIRDELAAQGPDETADTAGTVDPADAAGTSEAQDTADADDPADVAGTVGDSRGIGGS